MNCELFLKQYILTDDRGNTGSLDNVHNEQVTAVINLLGGKTFNNGLYRIYKADEISEATKTLELMFPEYVNKITIFAYDWLGRQFVMNTKQVIRLEPGSGESFVISNSIEDFHNIELVQHANDALSVDFFNEWMKDNNAPISSNMCVGYKTPLFMGGNDDISNLELTDLSVYLELCAQLKDKTRMLSNGQKIGKISLH